MFHIDLPLEKECKFFYLAEFYLVCILQNRTFNRICKYLHFSLHKYCLADFQTIKAFEAVE